MRAPEAEIIVTARKQQELLSTLPATEHVVSGERLLSASGLAGSDALAREIPSLSISSLGPGRNRLFLRGIGDAPLNGFNQGSVAVLLDEARLNYDAPDPDWALVDVDQVEVLEGPQGPLYGTGALGGIVKISTNRPAPSRFSGRLSAGLSVTGDSGLSNTQSGMVNLPMLPDRLTLRAVAYRQQQAGWIDNVGGSSNSNSERLAGGRLAIRWTPTARWTVDLAGAIQNRSARDSQYVDGNLGPLKRPSRLAEPRDLDARFASMSIKAQIGALELTSVTSYSRQEAIANYDATPLASLLGTAGPTSARDDRNYRVFDQEVRIQDPHAGRLGWLAGLSLFKASTDANIVATDLASAQPQLTLRRSITEAALFGEANLALTSEITLGGGARIFSTAVDDEGEEGGTSQTHGRRRVRGAGDANVSWHPNSSTTLFVRAATAYRPGGTNVEAGATQSSFEADELASIELGSRTKIGRTVSLDGTVYAESWQHVQTDELLANGLVATRNAGKALDIGLEANLRWTPGPGLVLTSGFMAQSARLEISPQIAAIDDRRLPAVPQVAARLRLERIFRLGEWNGQAALGLRYTGATRLSFDPVLDRRTGAHATMDASLAFSRNGWTAALVGDNLTNSSADTFAFGNPYRVRFDPEHTPTRPRTIGITVGRQF